jgi:hypothetical protein
LERAEGGEGGMGELVIGGVWGNWVGLRFIGGDDGKVCCRGLYSIHKEKIKNI